MKQRQLDNKVELRQKKKQDYWANIEKHRAANKANYEKHREKRIAASCNYAKNNRVKVNEILKRYKAKKRLDPIYVLSQQMSCLVRISLVNKGFPKRGKTIDIVGCDWNTFASHIERQFLPNMTWDNRSEWHIDHIIPLASAKTEEDVIRLNHFTNLRPLWAKDNLSKGAKMEHLL